MKLTRLNLFSGVALLITVILYLITKQTVFNFLLWILIIISTLRFLNFIKIKLFWKIRNRLIFSSVFLIITPIAFLIVFFYIIINIIIAQYGTTVIDNILNRQLNSLTDLSDKILATDGMQNKLDFLKRTANLNKEYVNLIFFEKQNDQFQVRYKFPAALPEQEIPIENFKSFFSINNQLYQGVLKIKDNLALLISLQINEKFLREIETISDFRIDFGPTSENVSAQDIEKAYGSFKTISSIWLYNYHYLDFNQNNQTKNTTKNGRFLLFINYQKIFDKIKGQNRNPSGKELKQFVFLFLGLFGFFILISFFIGFKMIRVVTKSINQLTNGTERIRNGDFSYRIHTKSGDQLQFLADSFNEMAAGIHRLLAEEKVKQRLEEEFRIARSIQLKLLPKETVQNSWFDVAAINIPADEIAGDYFDYYFNSTQAMFLVADVSGKGASAAFYMAELKGLISYLQLLDLTPRELILKCQQSIGLSLDKSTFITMNVIKFMIDKNHFLFSRAGHTQAIFYQAKTGKCQELFPGGMAIGLPRLNEQTLEEIELSYNKDDILFIFSDGLTEIMNHQEEMLGIKRIMQIIEENALRNAQEIKQHILDYSIRFSGEAPQHDDLTFIVIKVASCLKK
jgi:serine phosphatase RsbU (regulator of sigma subunit)